MRIEYFTLINVDQLTLTISDVPKIENWIFKLNNSKNTIWSKNFKFIHVYAITLKMNGNRLYLFCVFVHLISKNNNLRRKQERIQSKRSDV